VPATPRHSPSDIGTRNRIRFGVALRLTTIPPYSSNEERSASEEEICFLFNLVHHCIISCSRIRTVTMNRNHATQNSKPIRKSICVRSLHACSSSILYKRICHASPVQRNAHAKHAMPSNHNSIYRSNGISVHRQSSRYRAHVSCMRHAHARGSE
jgi:hypothetical protein